MAPVSGPLEIQLLVRKSVGSNPTVVILFAFFSQIHIVLLDTAVELCSC